MRTQNSIWRRALKICKCWWWWWCWCRSFLPITLMQCLLSKWLQRTIARGAKWNAHDFLSESFEKWSRSSNSIHIQCCHWSKSPIRMKTISVVVLAKEANYSVHVSRVKQQPWNCQRSKKYRIKVLTICFAFDDWHLLYFATHAIGKRLAKHAWRQKKRREYQPDAKNAENNKCSWKTEQRRCHTHTHAMNGQRLN